MVSKENCLESFRPQLTALDDEALAVASSKGLVRRALKDLQKRGELTVQGGTDSLVWAVDDYTVTLPVAGFLEAHCTCPATDVCRHMLMAYIWGRSHLQASASTPKAGSSDPETTPVKMPSYSLEELVKWASKPIVRQGLAFLDQESYEIKRADPIIATFPRTRITCRYFAATGLAGMLCSCKSRQVCLHQVATVAAVLRSQGIALALPESPPTVHPDTSATSAAQVIAKAQTLLEKTTAVGLLHLSEVTHQRFVTLAVSAQGAKLPRLARILRSIADDINLSLKRNAAADSDRLFRRMAQTYALCAALQQTAPAYSVHLAGQSKSHYEAVGTLELVGMGAYPWQTQSGYGGLTVLFWDPTAQQWCSWSESRPLFHRGGFNPRQAYRQPGPWEGITHPAEASQSYLCLYNARRNYQQRLSSSSQTLGIVRRLTRPEDWQFIRLCFQDWEPLRQHIASTSPMGLAESAPLDRFAVIQPYQWASRRFDSVQQQFTWTLLDQDQRPLFIKLRFTSSDAIALEMLEHLDPVETQISGVIGSFYLEQGDLYCHPIALCRQTHANQSAVVNLHFPSNGASAANLDPNPRAKLTQAHLKSETIGVSDAIGSLVTTLLQLAEKGESTPHPAVCQGLTQKVSYLESTGITTLANAMQQLVTTPTAISSQLLKIRYLCHLYLQVFQS